MNDMKHQAPFLALKTLASRSPGLAAHRAALGWRAGCVLLVLLLTAGLGLAAAKPASKISAARVDQLRCEYARQPLGIDAAAPRLNWIMQSQGRGQSQTAYQILVASSRASLDANRADLWDSGKVVSDQSIQIKYQGRSLVSRQQCFWKVRIWDRDNLPTAYSEPASWEMGLLDPADFKAQWIGYSASTPYLRKAASLWKPIKQARLYASALGLYQFRVNGERIGNDVFTPGWTDYNKRVQYQTYDITSYLRVGVNAFGMVLGDGWYCGNVGLTKGKVYGTQPWAFAQIEIVHQDGSVTTIVTDGSWKAAAGPIEQSDMLMGETYDARKEIPGWDTAGFADSAWAPVVVGTVKPHLVAPCDEPVRATEELKPIKITEPKVGHFVFDLGQNMVGWARLKVKGMRGTKVTLRFAEILNPDGTIYTTNLRGAKATDYYTLKGGEEEIYEPTFTFHGFRYVELTDYPGVPALDAITGVVVHSDTTPSGVFACSSPLLNKLQHNIVWGQRGNFVSVPTDCPQRDERLGWMGDAQIFVKTATFNMDVSRFFTKWMIDVEDAQRPDGSFTDVSPFVACGSGTAAWGDAGVIVPWAIYLAYGDTNILAAHYAAGARWVDYLKANSKDLLRPDAGYGDWLSIKAETPKDVLGTAYFGLSTRLMANYARVLGKTEDARKYEDLFQQIKAAFNKAYVAEDGRIKGNTQTCYVLALQFDLLPAEKRAVAAKYLVQDIASKEGHLSTGFVGVGHLMPVLSENGYLGVAYRLLNNETFPSWLYSVLQGATTIWERWDGWTQERGFQDPGMNSFNHYSFGSVGGWMYENVAGIGLDPAQPAFKHIIIRPQPGGGITSAKADYRSIHGQIVSDWTLTHGMMTLKIKIPANTTASVYIPTTERKKIMEGAQPAESSTGVKYLELSDGCCVYSVESGEYEFKAPVWY